MRSNAFDSSDAYMIHARECEPKAVLLDLLLNADAGNRVSATRTFDCNVCISLDAAFPFQMTH